MPPIIKNEGILSLQENLKKHAPPQGGIEYQTDLPGHIHAWHQHNAHERLVVQEGTMLLEWLDEEGKINQQEVSSGDIIELPSGTPHQSTAGPVGCIYLIRPEGGKAAQTFLYDIEGKNATS